MKINNNFILREIGGDYILVPMGETTYSFNGLISLNEVAVFIWKKLINNATRNEIIASIVEDYDVQTDVAENDVDEFIKKLYEAKIISYE